MADDAPKKEGGFNWLDLAKAVALPLVLALLGGYLNSSLDKRQTRDNNMRLYADMMDRREEADSALRKDMFNSILGTFLVKDVNKAQPEYFENEVLKIELLAYNFDESLDLGPLFKHIQRELAGAGAKTDRNLLWRLEKVAKDVNERQLSALADSGAVVSGDVNFDTGEPTFGESATVKLKPGEKRAGPTLCMSINAPEGGRHYRQFKIAFLDYKEDRREVELDLAVSKPLSKTDCQSIQDPKVEQANTEAKAQFWVGMFAFPMIDNTRLTLSERCSVSVLNISADTAELRVAYFQASRASLKDKLYYDEVLHDLLNNPAVTNPKQR